VTDKIKYDQSARNRTTTLNRRGSITERPTEKKREKGEVGYVIKKIKSAVQTERVDGDLPSGANTLGWGELTELRREISLHGPLKGSTTGEKWRGKKVRKKGISESNDAGTRKSECQSGKGSACGGRNYGLTRE